MKKQIETSVEISQVGTTTKYPIKLFSELNTENYFRKPSFRNEKLCRKESDWSYSLLIGEDQWMNETVYSKGDFLLIDLGASVPDENTV